MPLLSIIIPVYNVENYLRECLDSILSQDINDYEVILVNNASTDNSLDICKLYQSMYSNFKIINLDKNVLPAGARNIGLQNATGEYVHFCDSDDYYTKNSFVNIIKAINKNKADVFIGKFVSKPEKGAFCFNDINYNTEVFRKGEIDLILKYLLEVDDFICTVWRFVVNREFLLKNKLYFLEGFNCEDAEWVPKIICLANKIFLIEKPIYCYRPRVSGSITATKTYINSSKSHLIVALSLLKFIKENKFNGIRKDYVIENVEFLLSLFGTRCDTLEIDEIKELSQIIENNMNYIGLLKNRDTESSLFDFVEKYGAYEGLCLYKNYVIERTIQLARGKEDCEIYVFPTGYNGEGTARILNKAGYNVIGFLDNSENKNKWIIDGLEVNFPSILNSFEKVRLETILFIISTQNKEIVEILKQQIKKFGVDDRQIAIRIY